MCISICIRTCCRLLPISPCPLPLPLPLPHNPKRSDDEKACSLIMDENPLTTFVELPEEQRELQYSSLMVGVLKGALEMVQMRVDVTFVKDALLGDDTTELRLTLLEILNDEPPPSDD